MNIKKLFSKESFLTQLFNFGLGPVIGIIISLITVPITTRLLAPEEYGKTSIFSLVITLFDIIVLLGFDQSYVRFYNDKTISKRKLLDNCLFVPIIFCVILLPILFVFRKSFSQYMFNQYEPIVVLFVILYLPVVLLNRFAFLSLRMELKGKLYSFLNIFQQVVNFVVLFSFLFFYEKSFKSLIYATIISTFLTSFIAIIVSKQFFPFHKLEIDKKLLKDLLLYAIPLVPTSIMAWMMSSFDKVALRTWSGFEELGQYSAALKIVSIVTLIQNIFSTTWTPIAYKWFENNEPQEKYEDAGSLTICIMTIILSFIIVFRKLIMLYLGSAYRNSANILVFLMFTPIMTMVSTVTGQGVGFAKKTIYNVYVWIISSVVNLIGNYILVPKYGAVGAAVSTCFSYIIFFIACTLFSRHVWFKFNLTKYFINIVFLLAFGINLLLFNSSFFEYILFFIVLLYNGYIILKILKRMDIL